MLTLHPSARAQRDGTFRPMVIIRNPKGQCIGSRVAHVATFATKDEARNWARGSAHIAASRLVRARVA